MTGRNRIVYIPYRKGIKTINSNQYVSNMIEILEEKYCVTGELSYGLNIFTMLRTKAVFLNWIEDTGLTGWMKFQLILYKIFGAKIIWVFHNKYPHDMDFDKMHIDNMGWLARNSNFIVLHSKSSRAYIPDLERNEKKAVYVPHILYEACKKSVHTGILKEKYGIGEHDFVFTIFGRIRPYKNIESGIAAFQRMKAENAKLLIAGPPAEIKYAKKIRRLCAGNRAIILDMRYHSDSMLDAIIAISDVILLTHTDKSSMNSGVMMQAFSRGKTVIAPDICMARDLIKYGFFYMYRNSLETVMLKAYRNGKEMNKKMGEMARQHIYQSNNREVVKRCIDNILK